MFEAFLTRHRMRGLTKVQAAIHEAAHFFADERVGKGAYQAHIHGSPFGRYWGGEASSVDSLDYLYADEWTADQLRREAWIVLAGLIAEELIGGGDAFGSVGELVEAAVLAFKAADVVGRDRREVLREVVAEAVSLVECWRARIEDFAVVLERRKRITCFEGAQSRKSWTLCRNTPSSLRRSRRGAAPCATR